LNHEYVLGTDTAIGGDEMVHTVLDTTQKPFRIAKISGVKGASKSPQMHLYDFVALFESYLSDDGGNMKHALETWNGESVRFYHDMPDWIKVLTKTYGSWRPDRRADENRNKEQTKSNLVKKADLIISLKKLLEARELKIPNDAKLIQQLSIYREDDKGAPNDRVMSLALACWLATEGSGFRGRALDFLDW
jgi:hypothetical protein